MTAPILTLPIALLVYEFLITFGQEVQLFWKGKWSGATILFFLNRYITLSTFILDSFEYMRLGDFVSFHITWISRD